MLGKQDLYGGSLVSALFSKQSAPPSQHSAFRILHGRSARSTDMSSVEPDDTEKSDKFVDTKSKKDLRWTRSHKNACFLRSLGAECPYLLRSTGRRSGDRKRPQWIVQLMIHEERSTFGLDSSQQVDSH